MAETNMAEAQVLPKDAEQRERLISKAQEGLVESISQPDGVKQSAPAKEGHRFTKTLACAILACAFGSSFQFGYHIGCTNIPEDIIKGWINASHEHMHGTPISDQKTMDTVWGLSNGLFTIGGMFGGIAVGTVADKFGRRNSLLFNNAFAVIAAALFYAAYHVDVHYLYFLGRFIIGLNAGLNSGLSPMYLVEISPTNLRGSIGSIPQLFVTISILTAQIFGLPFIFGTDNSWPLIFAFTIVPVVVQLCALPLCPESPKYSLIVKGNKDQAESDLKKLRGENDVQTELEQIDEEAVASRAHPQLSMGAMFRAPLQWPLVLAMFMMVSQQLSGINAAMFYSRGIFKNAGLQGLGPDLATIGMGTVNVLMTFVSVVLVERLGRRTLHLTGIVGMLFSSAFIAISMLLSKSLAFFSYLSVASVQLFVISFAIGPGSIPWFYVSELFPSNARGNANSIAVLTNWAANTLVVFSFKPIAAFLNEFAFFIFTALLILFFLFAYKFLPETKNKSLEEVQAEMDRLRGASSHGEEKEMITTGRTTTAGAASTDV